MEKQKLQEPQPTSQSYKECPCKSAGKQEDLSQWQNRICSVTCPLDEQELNHLKVRILKRAAKLMRRSQNKLAVLRKSSSVIVEAA